MLGVLLNAQCLSADIGLGEDFAATLRACDWLSSDQNRVYVILDDPQKGWSSAVAARIQQLPRAGSLRIAGYGWDPSGCDARTLMERIEQLLTQHRGTPLLELED